MNLYTQHDRQSFYLFGFTHQLCHIPGAAFFISAYHPIRHKAQWVFPRDVEEVVNSAAVPALFDFVLDTRAPVDIGGCEVATWAHGVIFYMN